MLSLLKNHIFSLHNRYIPALTLIAVFSTLAFINVQDIMNSIENDGKLINVSGRQRMLSQHIILLSQEYIEKQTTDTYELLKNNIDLMEKEHKYLLQRPLSLELQSLYFEEGLNLDLDNFIINVNNLLQTKQKSLLSILQNDSKRILQKFNKAVVIYELENKEKLQSLKNKERYLYLLTIITLLLEALFVFYPANKKIKEEIEKSSKKEQELYTQENMIQMMEMIGNIAHHWRQPLSVISTATSGMQLQKNYDILGDDFFDEATNNILTQTQKLSTTIDQFSEYLNMKDIKSSFNLDEFLRKVLDIVNFTLKNFDIELITNIDTNEMKIESNKTNISQVILNIIYNARDILIERKIQDKKLYINLYKSDDSFVIEIEDNGGGIPKCDIKKIFDPYFTTKHKSVGTGLGLHISYTIVTVKLKGDIEVSNGEKGAKFIITLPLA